MEFEYNETHQMIKKSVREFAEKELAPESAHYDEVQETPVHWMKKMAEMGLTGMAIPTELGGAGLDYISYSIAIEEISRIDASAGVMLGVNNGLACEPLYKWGTEKQKKDYLTKVASGEWVGAYALTEPGAGSDAAALTSTAELKGGEWHLNGSKIFVTNGYMAKLLITYARTDPGTGPKGISAFIVPDTSPGYQRVKKENKLGIRASDTELIAFDDCRIPEDHLLGTRGEGFKIAMATLDVGRIGIASQALGISQAALEAAVKYSKERKAFGGPISNLQAIQFKLADMATQIDAARLLTHRACWMKDQGMKHTTESSMAKLFASEACKRIVDQALQIHGGYGFVKDYPVERYFRDQKITELYEGTSEIQRLVIARSLLRGS